MTIITEAAWEERFGPFHQSEGPLDLDAPIVSAVDVRHVWTQCSNHNGSVIYSGLVRVNREGFWLTLRPWDEELTVCDQPEEGDAV